MITGSVTSNVDFSKKADQYREGMQALIRKLTFKLLAKVKNNLSGGVLNVKSGRLRRSTNAEFTSDGMTGSVGTNVIYGAVHELGLQLEIREHMRTMKMVFGRPLDTPITVVVQQHLRKYPEKSFLRTALKDMNSDIETGVNLLASQVAKS